MLLEYILLPIPVILFIVKVMEWTGNYLVLVFFCATALVKLFLMWVYPRVIAPLFSKYEDLASIDYASEIMEHVERTCEEVGYKPSKILLEKSYDYDVHTNASCAIGRIILCEPLFEHHGEHCDEIISVLIHELGHWK